MDISKYMMLFIFIVIQALEFLSTNFADEK